jgi:hypothetical protein
MKNTLWRASAYIFLAALTLAGCGSLPRARPVSVPVPVKTAVTGEKAAASGQGAMRPLFVIARNKNANVVHYEASLAADGELDPAAPVTAYWELLAEDGRRKKLNWLEKKKAYGIRIKPAAERGSYTLTLAAASWLPLLVRKAGDSVRAEVAIGGRPAVLEKMFIQAKDKLLGPKVEYIELFGKDLETGEALREKILPK